MKKFNKIFLIILFSSIILILNAKDEVKSKKITDEYLINSKWSSECQYGFKIIFKKNTACELSIDYVQDFAKFECTYKIENDKITIIANDTDEVIFKNGTLIHANNSVKYQYYLHFDIADSKQKYISGKLRDNIILWNKSSEIKQGTKINLNSNEVIVLGSANAKTTTNAKIREKPDINAKELEFKFYDLSSEDEMGFPECKILKYVPEGTDIVLLARTSQKIKVKNWENFWYYIEVEDDEYAIIKKKAWMYGEFIKIKK